MKHVAVIVVALLVVRMPLSGHTGVIASDPEFQSTVQILGTWIDAQIEYAGIPGLAIVHDRERVWSAGFGVRDLSTREPVTENFVYPVK